ncbi:MAG: lipocalin family protein [Bacteroidota bacterium]
MKFKHVLVLGLIASMAASCSSDAKTEEKKAEEPTAEAPAPTATEEASVVKNWVLENIDATAAMEGMPKENQEKMKTMMDQMTASQKGKMSLDFQEGGKVAANSPDMQGNWKMSQGTWALSADKKTLTVDLDGKKEEFVVQELTADKLNLEIKGEKMNMIFVPKK